MNNSIDTSPPWWDGQIAIPFTRDEWLFLLNYLRDDLEYFDGIITDKVADTMLNIVDRIEKNLGVE